MTRQMLGSKRLVLVAVVACSASPSWAGGHAPASATLGMTASVLSYTKVTPLGQAQQLVVTAADRARGFVDVEQAMHVNLRSNHPAGHRLVIEVQTGQPFTRIDVLGIGAGSFTLAGNGGAITLPVSGLQDTTYRLSFRFYLGDGPVGVQAWPLATFIEPA